MSFALTLFSKKRSQTTKAMRRHEAIAALRAYLPTIGRDFGVPRLALVGFTVPDEARDDSDIDLLVEYEVGPTMDSCVGLSCSSRTGSVARWTS